MATTLTRTPKATIPRWILISDYQTNEYGGMRTWGDIRGTGEKTRVDLYQFKGQDVWTACPTVGSNSWKSYDYPTLYEALQGAERWILEMEEHGFNCDGTAPQLRALDTPPYEPLPYDDCDEYR